MTLFEKLAIKAQQNPQKLVLPEGTEPRTLQAANQVLAEGIAQIIFNPLVSSKIPVKKLCIMVFEIPRGDKIFASKSNKDEVCKIEIITENRTTKPPIFKIVVIEFEILFIIIVPKLEFSFFILLFWKRIVFLFGFQNLNKNPTVNAPKICVKSKIIPILELLKIEIPTVPKINKGPELFVNASKCSPSVLLIFLSILKLLTIFAPVGYPLMVPIIIGKTASPDKLKIDFMNFVQYFSLYYNKQKRIKENV